MLAKFAEGEVVVDGKPVEVVVNNRVRVRGCRCAGGARPAVPRARRAARRRQGAGQRRRRVDAGLVRKALEKESDADIKPLLELTAASMEMKSGDKAARIAAIRGWAIPAARTAARCSPRRSTDTDEDIRIAAQKSLLAVQGRLAWGERAGLLFAGISLGSILLLAALGLAITYGLMGVINMAHGELIMIGAYTTYVVQNFFKANLPRHSTGTCSLQYPLPSWWRRWSA